MYSIGLLYWSLILLIEVSGAYNNNAREIKNVTVQHDLHSYITWDVKSLEENRTIEKVNVTIYYETLCPGSRSFFTSQLGPTVRGLGQHINLNLVPYGFAKVRESNGHYHVDCQHGPAECFGNKVHACAFHLLKNATRAALFAVCLMGQTGRQMTAIFTCGLKTSLDTESIRECAQGILGSRLLWTHGKVTRRAALPYVPYAQIEGATGDHSDLFAGICAQLKRPPKICQDYDLL